MRASCLACAESIRWTNSSAQGIGVVSRYIIFGAGLDSFAYRRPKLRPLVQRRSDPRRRRYQRLRVGLILRFDNEALIVLVVRQGLIKPYFSGEILQIC
jgi:hypothetical protein